MVNTGNNGGETPENLEPKTDIDIRGKFYDEFTKKMLSQKDSSIFLNTILKEDEINSDLKTEIEKFKSMDEKFESIDISTLSIFAIRNRCTKELLKLGNTRKELEKEIINEYELDSEEVKLLGKNIDTLSQDELTKILKNKKNKLSFLKSIFDEDDFPIKKEFSDFFSKFNISETCKQKLNDDSVPQSVKDDIKMIGFNFRNGILELADFQEIFEYNLFTFEEEKKLLSEFLPYVTVEEAEKCGFEINPQEIKEQILKDLKRTDLDPNLIPKLAETIHSKDIKIPVSVLFGDRKNINILCQKLLSPELIRQFQTGIDKEKEKLLNSAPKNFEEFKFSLSENKKVKNDLGKLEEGAFIQMKVKTAEGEETIGLEITEIDRENIGIDKEFGFQFQYFNINEKNEKKLLSRGQELINSYYDFQKSLNHDNLISFEVLTKKQFEDQKKTSKIETFEEHDALKLDTKEEIEKKEDDLRKQIKERSNELVGSGIRTTEDEKKIKYDETIIKLEEELSKIESCNIEQLRIKIDEIDSEGVSAGLGKGVGFYVEGKGKKDGFWTISDIKNDFGEIVLLNAGNEPQTLSFQDFLEGFKDAKAKRISAIPDGNTLIERMSSDEKVGSEWKKFEYNDSGIVNTNDKEKNGYVPVEHLIGKGEEYIKIASISGGFARVQFGLIKSGELDEKTKKRGPETRELYVEESVSLVELSYYIKKWKLEPINDYKSDVKETESNIERKGSFFSKLFSRKSISEILAGGKIGLDAIENYLKEGSSDHSAKAAYSMFSWILPEELSNDLKARVQGEERKRTDELIEKLKNLDSWEATALIEMWLKNKDIAQYKLDAAVMFMYKEYGSLYTKRLSKYSGTNLWYRALGGTPGDEPWQKAIKGTKDEAGQTSNFTEESAVFELIKRQCGDGRGGVKRRTRFHKEIKAMWPQGIEAEIEKGQKDGADIRSGKAGVAAALDEIGDGTHSCGWGFMQKTAGRGGIFEDIMGGPVVMMFSGAADKMDQRLTIKMKDIYKKEAMKDGALPLVLLDYMGSAEGPEELSKVIVELSKELAGENSIMYKWAKKILDNRGKSGNENFEKKKVEYAMKFWEEYGEVLSRALHMTNSLSDKYVKEENIVFLKKDTNYTLKKYYDNVRDNIGKEFSYVNTGYMKDWLAKQGMSGLNDYRAIKSAFEIRTSSLYQTAMAPDVWDEVFTSIKKVQMASEDVISKAEKKKILVQKYTDILTGLYESAGRGDEGRSLALLLGGNAISRTGLIELGLFNFHEQGKGDDFKKATYAQIQSSGIEKTDGIEKTALEKEIHKHICDKVDIFLNQANKDTSESVSHILNI